MFLCKNIDLFYNKWAVFIIATGSIICFKFLSEANTDRSKYEMLSKIGMTESKITRAMTRRLIYNI